MAQTEVSLWDLETIGNDLAQRWQIFGTAQDLVDQKYSATLNAGQLAYTNAQDYLLQIKTLVSALTPADTNIRMDDLTVPTLDDFVGDTPTKPPTEDLTYHAPTDLTAADYLDTAVKDKLYSDITDQSAAISAAVETAIFERELERSLLVHADAIENINTEWARRGFVLPNGVLAALITQAEIEYQNKRLDLSRDTAIKNFELSDANMKFAVQQAIAWYTQRVEVYKTKVQAEVSRLDAVIKAFLGEVEVYRGEAQVYQTISQAKIMKFDAEVKYAMAEADVALKNAEVEIRNVESINNLRVSGMSSIATVASHLAAGAMAGFSASASIQASNSASYSYSPAAPKSISDDSDDDEE